MNMFPSEKVIRISSYDGQTLWVDGTTALFEVGNYLGGGAAGTVYECEYTRTRAKYALKILNPLGYKLLTPAMLRKCSILTRGKTLSDDDDPNISKENVWWILNSGSKQYIAAYFNERTNQLKELSLSQCVQVWGTYPSDIDTIDDDNPNTNFEVCSLPNGQKILVPKLPPKYVDFVRKRSRIFREIKNMQKISNHPNVIRLEGVLEYLQDSKCTLFLVMELANGGELFDRIRVDCGTREETAKFFFQQLLGGVKHCHDQGVCHRDLKPENLLLQDSSEGTILKIADFGFSARFALAAGNDDNWHNNGNPQNLYHDAADNISGSPVRVLKSIVGSPFYVAPEILQARGYDGSKADIWSLGVILYAMLAGNLPFGQDLSVCKRFKTFCKWVRQYNLKGSQLWDDPSLDYPDWLFPSKFSVSSKGLIVSMLHPDPICRISVAEAMKHPLCVPPELSESKEKSTELIENKVSDDAMIEENVAEHPSHEEEIEPIDDCNQDTFDDQSGVFSMEEDMEEVISNISSSNISTHIVSKSDQLSPMSQRSGKVSAFPEIIQQTELFPHNNSSSSLSESFYSRSLGIASSPLGSKPPLAPQTIISHAIDDLITNEAVPDTEDTDYIRSSQLSTLTAKSTNLRRDRSQDDPNNGNQPPSFNDVVKKSTRFITAVPANEVLGLVESILLECRTNKTPTPIGLIGRVELNWDTFRLEVWGVDGSIPSAFALQLYLLPSPLSHQATPTQSRRSSEVSGYIGQSPSIPITIQNSAISLLTPTQSTSQLSESFTRHYLGIASDLYLVEFIRGQLEIFAFKRFYEWLRQKLSEIVKRDYAMKFFEHSSSPKGSNSFLQNFQQYS